jgi:hypothetical protein
MPEAIHEAVDPYMHFVGEDSDRKQGVKVQDLSRFVIMSTVPYAGDESQYSIVEMGMVDPDDFMLTKPA